MKIGPSGPELIWHLTNKGKQCLDNKDQSSIYLGSYQARMGLKFEITHVTN